MKKVHLVQHTHWDREWYFTENDSKALLYYFIEDVIFQMERDISLPPFILDAQLVVLDDYFDVAPENKKRISALIKQGRILIGPWYTQTDFLIVSAESITRNLLLGINGAEKVGQVMKVGYVPDSFGQTAQLPMFLNEFTIDRAVVWRGWSEHEVNSTEFMWRSAGGDTVTTAVFPWGYGCAKWLPTDEPSFTKTIVEKARKQSQFSATDVVILPNGNDQSPFEYQVPGMLERVNAAQDEYNFKASSFDAFFDDLSQQKGLLPTFEGELLNPKYMRIHRGIFSTRMDIKLLNTKLEKTVSQYLEPLLSLNMLNGFPYPQTAVNNIWREAMKSHAHDSIGCCNSDRVNSMVSNRLQSGIEMAEQLIELNFKKLCDGITASQQGTKVVVFNSVPKKRDCQVELTIYTPANSFSLVDGNGNPVCFQIVAEARQDMSTIIQELSNDTTITWYRKISLLADVKDIPAFGYTTIYIQESNEGLLETQCEEAFGETIEVSNRWLSLKVEADGSLTLLDKRSGKSFYRVFELTNGSDEGDNYNFSPLADDWVISSLGQAVNYRVTHGELVSTLEARHVIKVPKDLSERKKRQASRELIINMTLTLPHNRASIDANVVVENNIEDHRIQVLFPTGIMSDVHYADQPFGLIRRENQPKAMDIWKEENWTEAPVALYPMLSTVYMNDDTQGLAIVADGIREYEIHDNSPETIAITLLRSVGWLGQANLTYRPGRASGMVLPSPDSQIQGMHAFTFSLIPQDNGADDTFWRVVEDVKTPPLVYVGTDWSRFRMNGHSLKFPEQYSVFEWNTSLHFSTVKKAESSDDLIIRTFNPSIEPMDMGTLRSSLGKRIIRCSLSEQAKGKLNVSVQACTPITLRVES
ncbi:alpha-mannosidase [Photobacterium profundum]|uniref:glycoside hydrolase family 38 N-terminal domain-containing protein n=1 Tax=Photobacterium profundum TaxID=74109 RepID=UPI003D10646B